MNMMWKNSRLCLRRAAASGERGFAAIEILVALALVGIAGVCFLSALTTVSRSAMSADKTDTADSLAVSQMEYTMGQDYDDVNDPPQYNLLPDIPDGWSVSVTAQRLDPESDGSSDDDGLQAISVTVGFGGETEVLLTSRKVNIDYVP